MFLKRVDLCGFKSFPERTQMEFGPGISAVVGPNGSGKSNIADSIRWVLGEQSARAFRGLRMEDVIFAGNHKRKPLSFAEVSLTIDNSDRTIPLEFSEVTVTRRVFRDGEGEYLINMSPCRLRDISEWLSDCGIGKDSFSVLAQGQVDEVLAAKPEERRALFEEVAGIVRFRNRKKDAARKLTETEEGLTRLGDIIQEIERQLGPLKEQSEKAEKHLELRKRLMALQVGAYLGQVSSAREHLDESDRKTARYRERLQEAAAELERLEREIESLKAAAEESETRMADLKERLKSLEVESGRIAEQLRSGEDRLRDIVASRENLARERESLEAALESLRRETSSKAEEASRVAGALEAEVGALSLAEKSFEEATARLAEAEEQLERRKAELIEVLNELSAKKNDAAEARVRMDAAAREISRASQEKAGL
ncbi:MAG: AAA family ATPase, partial [Firmicutes bacterium]|nr:AAA family ATPase [Bacillota bacterium]